MTFIKTEQMQENENENVSRETSIVTDTLRYYEDCKQQQNLKRRQKSTKNTKNRRFKLHRAEHTHNKDKQTHTYT